jgi:hypothetical protein
MRSSGLKVRRFSSVAQERAFRWDYARRFSGQRRLAIAIFTALWVVWSIRDFCRLNVLDPAHLHHNELIFLRVAGAIGMTIPVLLWAQGRFEWNLTSSTIMASAVSHQILRKPMADVEPMH